MLLQEVCDEDSTWVHEDQFAICVKIVSVVYLNLRSFLSLIRIILKTKRNNKEDLITNQNTIPYFRDGAA